MHNNLVRNAIIFSIVVLYVIAARNGLVNALFSIWVGAWAMGKLFKPFFGPHQGFEDLTVDKFIPHYPYWTRILGLLFESTRKQTFFVLIWWASGVVVALVTYKLLEVLLISP